MIGLGNSQHFFNQSESKLKPIVTWALDFSSTSNGLIIFDIFSSSGWLLRLLQFGFTPLNHKALNKYFSIKLLCKDLCSDSSLLDRWRRPVAVHETLLPLQYIYLTIRFGLWYCWIFLHEVCILTRPTYGLSKYGKTRLISYLLYNCFFFSAESFCSFLIRREKQSG